MLTTGKLRSPQFEAWQIARETVRVKMRDGVRLATDLYLPPVRPAPAVATRTPYDRTASAEVFMALARQGYVVISQDCRGTGESEPDSWEFGIFEREDSFDFVEWVSRQDWFNGFLGGCGGSYAGQTQWEMARHPRMSAVAPECGGFVPSWMTVRLYNFVNAYSRSVGNGDDKIAVPFSELERQMVQETLAGGFFNDPLRAPLSEALLARYSQLDPLTDHERKGWLWEHYNTLPPAQRAELLHLALTKPHVTFEDIERLSAIFGHHVTHGFSSEFTPGVSKFAKELRAPSLMMNGWYDWDLGGTFVSWDLIMRESNPDVAARCRLLIAPSSHNMAGYREGREGHPELERDYRSAEIIDLLVSWYTAVCEGTLDQWPTVIYYLMGANQWRAASVWPPPETRIRLLYLGANGMLSSRAPTQASQPDQYIYDPCDPTPTLGGGIVSYVYQPGSVDVSEVQSRSDVLTYTTPAFHTDLDVVGPLRLVLHASSSAVDTDFSARLTDVFPDGRAIQLQSGILRARYREPRGEPELLNPGQVYRLEIDMWATANRFRAGHRMRLDISSADFPRYDRNSNRGGDPGPPIPATQTVYHDPERPSHLLVPVCSGQLE